MTDIPIIFSAPMVRALLAGNKTMTRRLAWRPAHKSLATRILNGLKGVAWATHGGNIEVHSPWRKVKAGDRLWVRENFFSKCGDSDHLECCRYGATYDGMSGSSPRWTPSIHMPRWASRLTLIVTETKTEQLQAISEQDAIEEGMWRELMPAGAIFHSGISDREGEITALSPRTCFERLWGHLHGAKAWDANPDVVAMAFRVVSQNIDAIK